MEGNLLKRIFYVDEFIYFLIVRKEEVSLAKLNGSELKSVNLRILFRR